MSAATRIALAVALGVLCAAPVQAGELTRLTTMPLDLGPMALLTAGTGLTYQLFAELGEGKPRRITGNAAVNLGHWLEAEKGSEQGRFRLIVTAQDQVDSALILHIVATNRRCLLTSFNAVLDQAVQYGRVIEFFPITMHSSVEQYPTLSRSTTICTNDRGRMLVHFARPAFDMLELTIATYSSLDRIVATSTILSPLLTY